MKIRNRDVNTHMAITTFSNSKVFQQLQKNKENVYSKRQQVVIVLVYSDNRILLPSINMRILSITTFTSCVYMITWFVIYVHTYVRMYVCVCVYVLMHVCMYLCMYVCIYVCMYLCLYVWVYVCMYGYIYYI